jgi:hypothetical protein
LMPEGVSVLQAVNKVKAKKSRSGWRMFRFGFYSLWTAYLTITLKAPPS